MSLLPFFNGLVHKVYNLNYILVSIYFGNYYGRI